MFKDATISGARFSVNEDGTIVKYKPEDRILKLVPYKHGLRISVQHNGEPIQAAVHRIVATAFIPNPHELKTVLHLDGDNTNNHYSNLQWCTTTGATERGKKSVSKFGHH